MRTSHVLHLGDARAARPGRVHLVVTSPPYPMIAMWDELFRGLAPEAGRHLDAGQGFAAFEAMHGALDPVWEACAEALVPGGLLCVNVGDATRTIAEEFALYPNHARITTAMLRLGLTPLPDILWRKPTNAPNKFMGSGMLPGGAYVTYEHEYVLVFRKGGKRTFPGDAREERARSAYFWEERNTWFSDLWSDLRGTDQALADDGARARSAAFPLEIPWRLVLMYTVAGDTVLDPFAGTGTTMAAALAAGRSSVGWEVAPELVPVVARSLAAAVRTGDERSRARLAAHRAFVADRIAAGKQPKHVSDAYGFPVVTNQETQVRLWRPVSIAATGPSAWQAEHEPVHAGQLSSLG